MLCAVMTTILCMNAVCGFWMNLPLFCGDARCKCTAMIYAGHCTTRTAQFRGENSENFLERFCVNVMLNRPAYVMNSFAEWKFKKIYKSALFRSLELT